MESEMDVNEADTAPPPPDPIDALNVESNGQTVQKEELEQVGITVEKTGGSTSNVANVAQEMSAELEPPEPESTDKKMEEDEIRTDSIELTGGPSVTEEDLPAESHVHADTSLSALDNNEQDPIMDKDVEENQAQNPVHTAEGDDDMIENPVEENETIGPSYNFWDYQLPSDSSPKFLVGTNADEFKAKKSCKFLKGCKWAPDGSCLLSCSDDDNLRIFNFPSCFSSVQDWTSEDCLPEKGEEDWGSALKIKEGGLIYDYCWYPLMSSMDPVTSCFLSTSSEAPIHLWDAFSGTLRASYQPFNHLEQLVAARSLAFDPTGMTIYSGYEKCIRIFNITRPGKECVERPLKQQHADLNQYGIIASICVNPALRSFYAVGSFDKTVGLYCEDGTVICLLQGHTGGVTHMKFSTDGMTLYTGSRNDTSLFAWDMRKMSEKYKVYDRVVTTHQRVYFDITPNDRYLISGGTDGVVRVYETESEDTQPCCVFKANSDCVNGVSCNPFIPLLATSSGQRHFYEIANDSDDDEMFVKSEGSQERSCDIKLWKIT